MAVIQNIQDLTWFNLVEKLKPILKRLSDDFEALRATISPSAPITVLGATTNLPAVAATYADLAAARTSVDAQRTAVEARLDGAEAKIDEIITKLKAAGLISA